MRTRAALISGVTAAGIATVLLASGGRDASSTKAAAPRGHAHGVRAGCSRRSEANFPHAFADPRNLVIGPLVLHGAGEPTPASVIREFGGNKFPVLVKAGHTVTVQLPRRARRHAGLAYAGLGDGPLPQGRALRLRNTAHTMTFIACQPGKPTAPYRPEGPSGSYADGQAITFWSGFVIVPAPACVTLEVYVDDEPSPRRAVLDMGAGRCPRTSPRQ